MYTGGNRSGMVTRPILHAMLPLLTIGKGKDVAINCVGTLGNLAKYILLSKFVSNIFLFCFVLFFFVENCVLFLFF